MGIRNKDEEVVYVTFIYTPINYLDRLLSRIERTELSWAARGGFRRWYLPFLRQYLISLWPLDGTWTTILTNPPWVPTQDPRDQFTVTMLLCQRWSGLSIMIASTFFVYSPEPPQC